MDKITRQVRIEHWTQIMNECLNSGMNKTEWCQANGDLRQTILFTGKGFRKEAFQESVRNGLHPAIILRKGPVSVEISNSVSAELLSRIGDIFHAE